MARKQMNLIYALKNGVITSVANVESGLRCGCVCPACGEPLVAKKGAKMMHHFAHHAGGDCEYGYETSLHFAAKEKYKGAALLQKKHTVDFLQKKMKVNEGEVPQYYIEDSHPPIITPEEWDRVQIELAKRSNSHPRHNTPFSGKIVCGDCGSNYTSIVWHSNDKYRRTVWQCTNKFKNEVKCTTTHLTDKILKDKFLEMFAVYFSNRKPILDTLQYVQKTLTDTDFIDEDIANVEKEMEFLAEMIKQTVMLNASATVSEDEYRRRYNDLTERFKAEEEKYNRLIGERNRMKAESTAIGGMIFELTELEELPIEFDEKLWHATVDHLTVYNDERLVYTLKDHSEVTVML